MKLWVKVGIFLLDQKGNWILGYNRVAYVRVMQMQQIDEYGKKVKKKGLLEPVETGRAN